jgi:hypothetical protein
MNANRLHSSAYLNLISKLQTITDREKSRRENMEHIHTTVERKRRKRLRVLLHAILLLFPLQLVTHDRLVGGWWGGGQSFVKNKNRVCKCKQLFVCMAVYILVIWGLIHTQY